MFAEEIVRLKLDLSYLSMPAESRQAGKTVVCSSPSFEAKTEDICKEMFLNVWEKTDSTSNLHMLEGPKLLNIPLKVL